MAVVIENLTERLQRHLGIQQAQTIQPEDFAADGIARFLGRRGDTSIVARLWREKERANLIAGYRPSEHDEALAELTHVLDAALVVQREKGSGRPKTFLPFVPELVAAAKSGQLYREMGRTVASATQNSDGLAGALRMQEVEITPLKHRPSFQPRISFKACVRPAVAVGGAWQFCDLNTCGKQR